MDDLRNAKIGDLVAEDYRKASVFKKYGLDFCCGGGRSVAEACSKKGIDENDLVKALNSLDDEPADHDHNFNSWKLDFLADYIESNHHNYVRENIPLILEFARKVAKVHGQANPETVEVAGHFEDLAQDLLNHMHKEEFILFPYIRNLASEEGKDGAAPPPFGSIANPIRMMEHEHDIAGDLMKKIRALSGDYTPPAHACNTYMVLYAKLREFEEDLHRHIHLENNILFPKAQQLELELN